MAILKNHWRFLIQGLLVLFFVTVSIPSYAQSQTYLLISDDDVLQEIINDYLLDLLDEIPNAIDRDEKEKAFLTEEDTVIAYSEVFNNKPLRKSAILSAIVEEYAPDYLIFSWTEEKGSEETSSAYGMSQNKVKINIRVLNSTGRNVYRETASAKSTITITPANIEELLIDTVDQLDFVELEAAITKDTRRKQKRGQSVKIVFENLSQKDYFKTRDQLVELLQNSGNLAKVRDKYNKGNKQLTIRATLKGNLDEYYRNLYSSALSSEGLEDFELDREGKLFIFKTLSAARKRIVISGLSAEQYHHRLETYRDAIRSVGDVRQVRHKFIQDDQAKDSKLVFDFTYRDDLTVLEEQIWKFLEQAGQALNRELASISDNSIHYTAGSDATDLRSITVRISQVEKNIFQRIGTPLEESFRQLSARNINKQYDGQSLQLIYTFRIKDTMESLASQIEATIESIPVLENLVVETVGTDFLTFNYETATPATLPVTVEVQHLTGRDRQTIGHELAAVIEGLNGVERFREHYSDSDEMLKLRFRYQGNASFGKTLYRLILDSETLTGLEINQDRGKYVLTPLSAQRKRLVIAGLTAERYHHRLGVYRSAITTQEGVTDVVHEYLAGTAGQPGQLVFTFSHTGELTALENRVWTSLTAAGETPNRQLTAISDHMIQYQAGGEAVLTALFRNVVPTDYSQIRDSLDRIFKDLAVRNLERDYDDQAQLLAYRFESKQTTVQLDAVLWQQIAATPALQDLVPGTATDEVLEYSYQQAIVTVQFNNVTPGDYRKIGVLLDAIIKQLEVTDLKKSYDPDGYQLSYMFVTSVPPADLDTVLWAEIAKDEALSAIAQDATSGSTLGYFYLQERPATKPVSIVLKNLGPDVYNKIGRRFISAIKVVPGVDRLQREYSEDDQTLRLEFRYQGESIYTIDDAVWEAVKRDEALASLVMAGVTDNQLVYVLGGKDADRREVVIHIRKVSGGDYKIIATEFKSLLSHLQNVRDVSYHYDFQRRTVVFKFRFEGLSLHDLEDAIQRALLKPTNQLFQYVSKGADTARRMVYIYSDGAEQQKSETDDSDKEDDQQGSQPQQASSSQLADLVERLDATVVWIGNSEGGHGSGFFVTPDGYLLTNDHVVKNSGDLFVRTLDRDYLRVNIVKTDEELDLALLRVVNPQRTFKSVDIGNSRQLRKGQSVLNIGNPLDEEYEHSVTPGHIAGLNRHKGVIQLSLPTYGGQSGSPVFDMNGRVIGIIVSGATRIEGVDIYTEVKDHDNSSQQTGSDTTKYEKQQVGIKYSADTIGFAIPIDYARGLLELARP